MTVTTTTSDASFVGNDVMTVLPFNFRFFTDEDLVVLKIDDVTGVETLLVLGVDYTVTGAGTATGGTVVLAVILATGKTVNVARVLSPVQLTELINQGKFFPEIHENAFDYLTMLIQQTNSSNDRSMLFPLTDPPGVVMTLPNVTLRATKVLGFDALGNPEVSTLSLADIEAQVPLAAAQAAAAAASADDAADSATASAASAVSADGFSDLAEQWAENPEDDPVTTGPDKFSALHWAAKAEQSLSGLDARVTTLESKVKVRTQLNTTSGTSKEVLSIPSWVTKITVSYSNVSTNGTSILRINVGTASGFATTNYQSQAWAVGGGGGVVTSGFDLGTANSAAFIWVGTAVLEKISSTEWIITGQANLIHTTSTGLQCSGRVHSLPSDLDRVRFTTVNGTDAFDAGSVSFLYE